MKLSYWSNVIRGKLLFSLKTLQIFKIALSVFGILVNMLLVQHINRAFTQLLNGQCHENLDQWAFHGTLLHHRKTYTVTKSPKCIRRLISLLTPRSNSKLFLSLAFPFQQQSDKTQMNYEYGSRLMKVLS
jgi:hypothetical protein